LSLLKDENDTSDFTNIIENESLYIGGEIFTLFGILGGSIAGLALAVNSSKKFGILI
jgi:hypothetical protein